MVTCPSCGETAEPTASEPPLAICGMCGATLYNTAAGTTRAALADLSTVTPAALTRLRTARRAIAPLAKPGS